MNIDAEGIWLEASTSCRSSSPRELSDTRRSVEDRLVAGSSGGSPRTPRKGAVMNLTADLVHPGRLRPTASIGPSWPPPAYLARYGGTTRRNYQSDLLQWFRWCASHDLGVLEVHRAQIEVWAREMEESPTPGPLDDRAAAAPPRPASTGSRRSTATSTPTRPSMSDVPASTPSRRRWGWTGASWARSSTAPKRSDRPPTPSLASSGCWDCGSPKRSTSTPKTSPNNAGTAPSPSSARATSRR